MKDRPEIPTMREIAKAAKVSVMSVSRALKRSEASRTEAQQRIWEIAMEMGYRPNPLVSALMSHRARQSSHGGFSVNLAFLDPRSEEPTANGMFYRSAKQRAEELGYALDYFPYHPGAKERTRLRSILQARGVRGVIFAPVPVALSDVEFDFSGFSVVTLGHSVSSPVLPKVCCDIQALMYKALRYLEERGYRRVGLVMAKDADLRMLCAYSGAAMSFVVHLSHGLEVDYLSLPNEDFTGEVIAEIRQWAKDRKIEAILSSAEHLLARLREAGAKVPEEFGYLHLHRHGNRIASMDQLRERIGARAIEVLGGMVQHQECWPYSYPITILTPPELVEGETIPDITSRESPIRKMRSIVRKRT